MQFCTRSTGKSRQMVFIPDLNADSFMFFFQRGESWSLRDYSVPHRVREWRPGDLQWSADTLRRKARHSFDAPTVDTQDLKYWHAYTLLGNREVLGANGDENEGAPTPVSEASSALLTARRFPVVNGAALEKLPKAAKSGDLDRIYTSANGEDWVTWNMMNIIMSAHPGDWWSRMVQVARNANPCLVINDSEAARLKFWPRIPAPREYESASRSRMMASGDSVAVDRSNAPDPVEGASEIDLLITTNTQIVFIEAKLGADISMRTKHDPERNQIVRNIDCLIESAGDRVPYFWMIVRDTGPERAYVQLIQAYRQNPDALADLLRHRDPVAIRQLVRNLTMIRWADLAEVALVGETDGDDETSGVKQELRRRIGL